jgi:hypothetical protein
MPYHRPTRLLPEPYLVPEPHQLLTSTLPARRPSSAQPAPNQRLPALHPRFSLKSNHDKVSCRKRFRDTDKKLFRSPARRVIVYQNWRGKFLFAELSKYRLGCSTLRQTPEGYISKDIYIPYPIQKSGKRIFSYPFFEWDMLKDIYPYFRDINIFISCPILYPFFSTNLNFAAFFFFCAI